MPQLFQGPTKTDAPQFRFRSRLDGVFYWFRFRYMTQSGSWLFGLDSNQGEPLIEGMAIRVGQNILEPFDDARLPSGEIQFDDTSGTQIDPGRLDLGRRVRMIYTTADEVAAAAPVAETPTVPPPPSPPVPPEPEGP